MRTAYQVAHEVPGKQVFVNEWVVEKLMTVGQRLAHLRGPVGGPINEANEDLYFAYRNVCKLTGWVGAGTDLYEESEVEQAFIGGDRMMRELQERLFGLDTTVRRRATP